ncbi:MAG: hypothetical protein A3D27_03890 [Omnitrophica WOR_2 bacterium RIFCSPHIGHO2_02_FULL_46_37]|nr:MAG: hypothetical protein A3D27_03890 [Omnitrophica WOR_2 bacterium RIFCSPHIGHO2_02_FULL_46_37]
MIEPIGKTIGTIFQGLSSPRQDNKQRVYDTLLALLDARERLHVEPWSLQNKVLTLYIDSPARLYAFNLKKPRILKALQEKAGSSIIEQIRLKIGRPNKPEGNACLPARQGVASASRSHKPEGNGAASASRSHKPEGNGAASASRSQKS